MGRPKNFSREEVLEKAIPVFWKAGFADTSVQDLEKATGVNKSGLYSEFKDKEDLYLASLRHYIGKSGSKTILAAKPLGWSNIEKFLKTGKSCKEEKGCLLVNSIRELPSLPAQTGAIMSEHMDQIKALVVQNIRGGITGIDPVVLAEMILTFNAGLCLEQNFPIPKAIVFRKIENFVRAIRLL